MGRMNGKLYGRMELTLLNVSIITVLEVLLAGLWLDLEQ
jgi:hypothetical protein